MKSIFSFLVVLTLCIGCDKRTVNVTQHNASPTSAPAVFPKGNLLDTGDTVSAPKQDETKTVQEIIENYFPPTLPYDIDKLKFLFQIEGNFTGSGNREIIGFYADLREYEHFGPVITFADCFICDSTGEKVETVYGIGYSTILDSDRDINGKVEKAGLSEAFGKPIVWQDTKIGCAVDFNGNGKEELFLYSLSGIAEKIVCFEFDNTEFVEILRFESPAIITGTDPEKKIISTERTVESYYGDRKTTDTNVYQWDANTQRYETLINETHKYNWNDDTEEWEETP